MSSTGKNCLKKLKESINSPFSLLAIFDSNRIFEEFLLEEGLILRCGKVHSKKNSL